MWSEEAFALKWLETQDIYLAINPFYIEEEPNTCIERGF